MDASSRPVNISPRGRRQRLVVAVAMTLVAAAGLVLLIAQGQPRPLRLLLFVPFWLGALGYFQARAGT